MVYEIPEQDRGSYRPAAEFANRAGYEVLSIQHEYGIFGGEAGSYLMDFMREARMPIVTTLHTVLREPTPQQKAVMDELLELSERVVVMSKKGQAFLSEIHGVCQEKIDFIPHGIPNISSAGGAALRARLNIEGPMILTFGLLSPDKGIQYAIEAMPRIVAEHPGATYVVVGATHPNVRASVGEEYRESLVKLVNDLGVSRNVRFVDRFVSDAELMEYLGAMDVYITPYLNPKQITSGTLAFAVGAGKVVISTPYWYAEELLGEGRGILVPFRDSNAIAEAVLSVGACADLRNTLGAKARAYGKKMLWPESARSYLRSFARAKSDCAGRLHILVPVPALADRRPTEIPDIRLEHLTVMTDDTGMLQHATHTVPNRAEGYCVDDNARALLFTAYLEGLGRLPDQVSALQMRYLSFVLDAFNPETGRFRNFMSYQRDWLEDAGSEDSHGRSMWSLGALARRCRDIPRRDLARTLFEDAAPALLTIESPRAWAYGVLAADEYLQAFPRVQSIQHLRQTMAERLLRLYDANQGPGWRWFEQNVTYANARLPQALIIAGASLGDKRMLAAGTEALAWLMNLQTGARGVFAPIGSEGFYTRHGERAYYDQQPIEASSSVSACLSASALTGETIWMDEARRAFAWFQGENSVGQPLYDASTGGCRDGLHPHGVNQNQGAESTLAFLTALTDLRSAAIWPVHLAC